MKFFDSIFRLNSIHGFARLLIREMKLAGDPRQSKFDSSNEKIIFLEGNRQVGFANLSNLHTEYLAQVGADRNVFIKRAVRSLLSTHKSPPTEFEDARPDLLPTIRARSYFASVEFQARESGETQFACPYLPIGDHLGVGIVYDLPESMIMVQQEQLDAWNVPFLATLEIARSNLAELEGSFKSVDNRLYIADSKDNFDATRMVMTEWIRQLKVDGDPIVMVPDRDALLATGDADEKGLVMMARIAKESLDKPRRINGFAYRLDENDQWELWLPPPSFECFSELQTFNLESLAKEYAHQKTVLDENPPEGSTIFVATFNILRKASGMSSYCVWSDGTKSLLPETDEIAFASRRILETDEPPVRILTAIVVEVMGSAMIKSPLYPVRYFVDRFPSESELRHMQFLLDERSY